MSCPTCGQGFHAGAPGAPCYQPTQYVLQRALEIVANNVLRAEYGKDIRDHQIMKHIAWGEWPNVALLIKEKDQSHG